LGSQAELIIPPSFGNTETAILIVRLLSVLMGLWLWGLSMWFFIVSVGSLWKYVRPQNSMPFQMTWWSFVFPNTALVTATEALGTAFDSTALQIFGTAMAACLVLVWVGVFIAMIRCLRRKELLWPKEAS
jgi:tellurite resistance protein TehA-like permease